MLQSIDELISDIIVIPFDQACAECYGRTRADLKSNGITAPPVDMLIASAALAHDLTLVTHNTDDFKRIPGLRIDDCLTP